MNTSTSDQVVTAAVADDLAGLLTAVLPGTLSRWVELDAARDELGRVGAHWAKLLVEGTKAQRRRAAEAVILAHSDRDVSWWGTPAGHATARALPSASLTLGEAAAVLGVTRAAVQSALRSDRLSRNEHGVTVESVLYRLDHPVSAGRPAATVSESD